MRLLFLIAKVCFEVECVSHRHLTHNVLGVVVTYNAQTYMAVDSLHNAVLA